MAGTKDVNSALGQEIYAQYSNRNNGKMPPYEKNLNQKVSDWTL